MAESQIWSWERRHKRLLKRLGLVLALSVVVDLVGMVAIYFAERHAHGTQITSVGDALFFTTVQLFTVSSQIQNPFTSWGRVFDVLLQVWAVIVVAGSAGAMADFFHEARGV